MIIHGQLAVPIVEYLDAAAELVVGALEFWCGLGVREVKVEERCWLVLSLNGRRMTRVLAAGAFGVVFALAGLSAAAGCVARSR
jgi:hypothetical protein